MIPTSSLNSENLLFRPLYSYYSLSSLFFYEVNSWNGPLYVPIACPSGSLGDLCDRMETLVCWCVWGVVGGGREGSGGGGGELTALNCCFSSVVSGCFVVVAVAVSAWFHFCCCCFLVSLLFVFVHLCVF